MYFKNIHEFIQHFKGGKSPYAKLYEVHIEKYHITFHKINGRYDVHYRLDQQNQSFLCNAGTWEKIEKYLFELPPFRSFVRDKKLEKLLK